MTPVFISSNDDYLLFSYPGNQNGPFLIDGKIYVLVGNTVDWNTIRIMCSEDGGTSWSSVAEIATVGQAWMRGCAAVCRDKKIYIAFMYNTSADGDIHTVVYDPATGLSLPAHFPTTRADIGYGYWYNSGETKGFTETGRYGIIPANTVILQDNSHIIGPDGLIGDRPLLVSLVIDSAGKGHAFWLCNDDGGVWHVNLDDASYELIGTAFEPPSDTAGDYMRSFAESVGQAGVASNGDLAIPIKVADNTVAVAIKQAGVWTVETVDAIKVLLHTEMAVNGTPYWTPEYYYGTNVMACWWWGSRAHVLFEDSNGTLWHSRRESANVWSTPVEYCSGIGKGGVQVDADSTQVRVAAMMKTAGHNNQILYFDAPADVSTTAHSWAE